MSGVSSNNNNSFNRRFKTNNKNSNKSEYSQLSFKDNYSFKGNLKDEPMKIEQSKYCLNNFNETNHNQIKEHFEEGSHKYYNKFNSPSSKSKLFLILYRFKSNEQ